MSPRPPRDRRPCFGGKFDIELIPLLVLGGIIGWISMDLGRDYWLLMVIFSGGLNFRIITMFTMFCIHERTI